MTLRNSSSSAAALLLILCGIGCSMQRFADALEDTIEAGELEEPLEADVEVLDADPQLVAAGLFAEYAHVTVTDAEGNASADEATLEIDHERGQVRVVTDATAGHIELRPLGLAETDDDHVVFTVPELEESSFMVPLVWFDADADGLVDINVGEDSELVRTIALEAEGETRFLDSYFYDVDAAIASARVIGTSDGVRSSFRVEDGDVALWHATIPGAAEVAP